MDGSESNQGPLDPRSRLALDRRRLSYNVYMIRRMTKPTKWSLRPAKAQISLGIRPVWSVFAVRMKKQWVLSYPLSALRRLWSDCADAQGWFESSLGAKAILLDLSWGGSYSESASSPSLVASEINHIFEGRTLAQSQWVWLQSQWSLVRAPALPNTGSMCNLPRISHEIMDMVFLLFSLIQERQFLVIGESICTLDHFVLVNRLEGLSGAGWVVHLIASPGIIVRESANQIYCYICGIDVTISRSLHKFRWCWGGATSSSHTNPPTLPHALQYRTEWSLRIC